MRAFNIAGPCDPARHYMLPPERRIPQVMRLVQEGACFVVHAARQSGKTTAMRALAADLTASGAFVAAVLSVEAGAPFDEDGFEGAVLGSWRASLRAQLAPELQPTAWMPAEPGSRITEALTRWALASRRPLVLFVDEADALRDGAVISLLRQLRSGFAERPRGFPHSLALVGMRPLRDYVVAAGGSGRLGSSSPFNIIEESVTLRNFTRDEVAELYGQHTDETGRRFSEAAMDEAWRLSGGQPWLVNALARELVRNRYPDSERHLDAPDFEDAAQTLIQQRATHLDSLAARLEEDRVHAIIGPIMAGGALPRVREDDLRYVVDLGLLRWGAEGGLELSNPIYREVLARTLADGPRASMPQIKATWLDERGRLVPERLMSVFLAFWRQHADALAASAGYPEVAPHLVMMAFLDRVANGGGTVDREYAVGTGRMDLLLRLGEVRMAFELKVWREGRPDPLAEGLEQIDGYLGRLGLEEGWLVIFDLRASAGTADVRTRTEEATTPAGRAVRVMRG